MTFQERAEDLGIELEEFLELLKLFVDQSVSDLAILEEALRQGGIDQVVTAAHSIKGAAGNLGFQELYDAAKTMEMNARQKNLEGGTESIRVIKENIGRILEALP